jgi:hypothetical protein
MTPSSYTATLGVLATPDAIAQIEATAIAVDHVLEGGATEAVDRTSPTVGETGLDLRCVLLGLDPVGEVPHQAEISLNSPVGS